MNPYNTLEERARKIETLTMPVDSIDFQLLTAGIDDALLEHQINNLAKREPVKHPLGWDFHE